MTSKFELTISTDYVLNWNYVDAIRELFQNAIDNETTNPENKMYFGYGEKEQVLRIGNKTSILTLDTLLLGSSSKRDDDRTIGQHGEGYKIAFMVLLREDKKVTVYNYGAKEIWNTKLVKSRRFANSLVPTIIVEKTSIRSKIPSHDLMIEIEGITPEEYKGIVKSNLHLQEVGEVYVGKTGRILLSEKYKGKVFVKGLYVNSHQGLVYGYDFNPEVIKLDRDRKLVDSFNLSWQTSMLWQSVISQDRQLALKLIKEKAMDTQYITDMYPYVQDDVLSSMAYNSFKEEHGENSIPVENQDELTCAIQAGRKPVMVSEGEARIIKKAEEFQSEKLVVKTPREEFENWIESGVSELLSEEQVNEFYRILDRM